MPDCSFGLRIDAYYDGELEPDVHAIFERHLSECAECRAELESLQRLTAHFDATSTAKLSHNKLRRLYDTPQAPTERTLLPFAMGLMATAASILVVCSAWLYEVPRSAPTARVVAKGDLPAWEQLAMTLQVEPPSVLGGETAVAQADLADWMLFRLSNGREP